MTTRRDDGFVAFYREYTQTWLHALATAALTGFGMLTFVHRLFAIVAIAAYVFPPLVQYVRKSGSDRDGSGDGEDEAPVPDDTVHGTNESENGDRSDEEWEDGNEDVSDEGNEDVNEDETGTPRWTAADAPTDASLFDVAVAEDKAYAVGDGGTVVAREEGEWRVVLEDGPGAASNDLRGVSVAADGGVWVAGDGGAVGRIDPETGRHTDHSAPDGDTSSVSGVAATAADEAETVVLTDSSGRVRRGRYRDGELAWEAPVKPGSGASIAGVELDSDAGYVCDSGGDVFRTTDGGRTFESVDGLAADGTPTDVAGADGDAEACLVTTDDGAVHRYDGSVWTPTRLGDSLVAVDSGDEGSVAVGPATFERFGDADWSRARTPPVETLRAVGVSGVEAVVVGDGGTVVERTDD